MKLLRTLAIGLCTWLAVLTGVHAFPDRPITLVNAFPPGGASDVFARLLAQGMSEILNQNVVVSNRTGGGGSIGTTSAARAEPDGYTLMFAMPATHAILPHMMARLPYDPVKDFSPVSLVTTIDYALVLNPNVKAGNLAEFVRLLKQNPGKYSFGSAGNGSETHLMGEMLRSKTGVEILHVPYRGTGPALTAVVAGEVQFMLTPITAALPFVPTGQLRPIATIATARSQLLPSIPTIAEAGLPDFALKSWMAVFAPAGTPPAVINRLNEAIVKSVKSDKMKTRFNELGGDPVGGSPDELRVFLRGELSKYGALVTGAGVKAE